VPRDLFAPCASFATMLSQLIIFYLFWAENLTKTSG